MDWDAGRGAKAATLFPEAGENAGELATASSARASLNGHFSYPAGS